MILSKERLDEILENITNTKIGLYGDFCLDAYWNLDPRGSEISLETGLKAKAVASQNYSLGGASNVAANIAELKPKELKVFGIYGEDVFGNEMLLQLTQINANIEGMVVQNDNFDTYTFTKMILDGKEQPRIDFGTYNQRTKESDNIILDNLKEAMNEVDIFIINQQVPDSITNVSFIEGLNEIICGNPDKTFLVDSRHFADKFRNVSYKANNLEAAILINHSSAGSDNISDEVLEEIAGKLSEMHNRPMFITRGENGILAYNDNELFQTPGIELSGKLDIVGAGDTAMSAIACALGSGCNIQETIELANLAAGVTVQKLFQTGTANKEEIMSLFMKVNNND